MAKLNRFFVLVGLLAAIALAVSAVALRTQATNAGGSGEDDGDERKVAAGTIDDGGELLTQAKVTLEQAIAAAQGAASGDIGEVDIEYYNGTLVFNVDVGDLDVKVDAQTGAVLGAGED